MANEDHAAAANNNAPAADGPSMAGWRRNVAIFIVSQTVTVFGSMLVQYAIVWHLTLVTQSGTVLAISSLAGFGPQAIISIFGGVLADRHNRKLLIMAADAAIAVSTLILVVLMLNGVDDLWPIYVTLVIRSAGAGVQMPAVSALIPQITPSAHLMRVNGINSTIQSGMMLLAPAVAAAIYASLTIVAVLMVDIVTAAIGIGLLSLLAVEKVRRLSEETMPSYLADMRDGLCYVCTHPFVRWVLSIYAIVFILLVAPSGLTPLLVVRTFGDEALRVVVAGITIEAGDSVWKLTVNELAFSVGMIAGGAAVASWGSLVRNRIAMFALSIASLSLITVAMGLAGNMWLFFFLMLLCGFGVPFFSVPSLTLLQQTVEQQRQGRVFSFVSIAYSIAGPLGMGIFGPLADQVSVQLLLVVAGVLQLVVIAIAVLGPSGRQFVTKPESILRPDGAPASTGIVQP